MSGRLSRTERSNSERRAERELIWMRGTLPDHPMPTAPPDFWSYLFFAMLVTVTAGGTIWVIASVLVRVATR